MQDPRPRFVGTLRRYLTRIRHRGPLEVGSAILGSLKNFKGSAGVILFLERPTEGQSAEPVEGVTIRQATPADAEAYARDISTDSRFTFIGRLGNGTDCYLAVQAGRLVHATWVTRRAAWIGELSRYFVPQPGSAYVYESFTSPSVRGRGIYPAVLRHIAHVEAGRGVDHLWIGVGADNAASIRAIEKGGFAPAFDVSFEIRWGRVDISNVEGPKAAEAERQIRKRVSTSP